MMRRGYAVPVDRKSVVDRWHQVTGQFGRIDGEVEWRTGDVITKVGDNHEPWRWCPGHYGLTVGGQNDRSDFQRFQRLVDAASMECHVARYLGHCGDTVRLAICTPVIASP